MNGFTIACPACQREYLLPAGLMGHRGARVRCPACSHLFLVDEHGDVRAMPAGETMSPAPAPEPEGAPAAAAAANDSARAAAEPTSAQAHARAALDALVQRTGPGIHEAARHHRLFREHGPALLEAFDDFRRRAGSQAHPEVFRAEVRERLGVDLLPSAEAR